MATENAKHYVHYQHCYIPAPPLAREPCRGHLWVRGLGPAAVQQSREIKKERVREPMLDLMLLPFSSSLLATICFIFGLGLCKFGFLINEIADASIAIYDRLGDSVDLPVIYSKPNNFRHLTIDSESKNFVSRSAGSPLPHTLDTVKSPLFTRC